MRDAASLKHAQEMRKSMPEPETRLWLELRAARFKGIFTVAEKLGVEM